MKTENATTNRYYSGRTITRKVYFLLRGDGENDIPCFKIGLSKNPQERAKRLGGTLVHYENGSWHDERFYHQWFAHLRVERLSWNEGGTEWFLDTTGEIRAMLASKKLEHSKKVPI